MTPCNSPSSVRRRTVRRSYGASSFGRALSGPTNRSSHVSWVVRWRRRDFLFEKAVRRVRSAATADLAGLTILALTMQSAFVGLGQSV